MFAYLFLYSKAVYFTKKNQKEVFLKSVVSIGHSGALFGSFLHTGVCSICSSSFKNCRHSWFNYCCRERWEAFTLWGHSPISNKQNHNLYSRGLQWKYTPVCRKELIMCHNEQWRLLHNFLQTPFMASTIVCLAPIKTAISCKVKSEKKSISQNLVSQFNFLAKLLRIQSKWIKMHMSFAKIYCYKKLHVILATGTLGKFQLLRNWPLVQKGISFHLVL